MQVAQLEQHHQVAENEVEQIFRSNAKMQERMESLTRVKDEMEMALHKRQQVQFNCASPLEVSFAGSPAGG